MIKNEGKKNSIFVFSWLNINVFLKKKFKWRKAGVKKKIQKTLILVLEVIVQPPKHALGSCIINYLKD